MKRRDLEKKISKAAKAAGVDWLFVREGSKHTVYTLNGVLIPIPRHNEIVQFTAEGIMKECEFILGEGWWR